MYPQRASDGSLEGMLMLGPSLYSPSLSSPCQRSDMEYMSNAPVLNYPIINKSQMNHPLIPHYVHSITNPFSQPSHLSPNGHYLPDAYHMPYAATHLPNSEIGSLFARFSPPDLIGKLSKKFQKDCSKKRADFDAAMVDQSSIESTNTLESLSSTAEKISPLSSANCGDAMNISPVTTGELKAISETEIQQHEKKEKEGLNCVIKKEKDFDYASHNEDDSDSDSDEEESSSDDLDAEGPMRKCKKSLVNDAAIAIYSLTNMLSSDDPIEMEDNVKGENPVNCDLCGRESSRPALLKIHKRRVHSGMRRFRCDGCGKSFLDSSDLKKHKRIHTGERPFECQHCAKTFTQAGNLKTHMRTHTGEKPFLCDFCGRSFAMNHHLKTHLKTHISQPVAVAALQSCSSVYVSQK